MPKIKKITARQILDSRGIPTIEARVILDNNIQASASVPSGTSKGKYEVLELRDGDQNYYQGKSVLKSVNLINTQINSLLRGKPISDQERIDKLLIETDGTANKSNLGGNTILAVSLVCLRASSLAEGINIYQKIKLLIRNSQPLGSVIPLFNFINGGLHGNRLLSFQEFLVIPKRDLSFDKSLQLACHLYQLVKQRLLEKKMSIGIGEEGGFVTEFNDNQRALDFLIETIDKSGYKYRQDVFLGLDMAASTFYRQGQYFIAKDQPSSPADYLNEVLNIIQKYGLILVEDPFAEDDWNNWTNITSRMGQTIKLVADDLLVTNKKRLTKAISQKAANAIIIKMNQIGTISETLEVVNMARKANFSIIVSHRSGETNDDFVSDLAVGVGADYVKFGAPVRGERLAKYNRLLSIYQDNL